MVLRARRCIDVGRMAALIDNKLGIAGDSVETEGLWLKLLSKPLSLFIITSACSHLPTTAAAVVE